VRAFDKHGKCGAVVVPGELARIFYHPNRHGPKRPFHETRIELEDLLSPALSSTGVWRRGRRRASVFEVHGTNARPILEVEALHALEVCSTKRVEGHSPQLPRKLTEWKWLIVKDVTGCCRFVAALLPIKCLIINDVTDVADF
jgi:hypothetical protein